MGERHWTDEYLAYLRSSGWKKRRKAIIASRGHRCERCKQFRFGKGELHLHHLSYARLGRERDGDLLLVCCYCHEAADQERAARSARAATHALWAARFNGWATARYGEDWECHYDPWELEEEFEDFLERVEG
jgi:hypothetical protein